MKKTGLIFLIAIFFISIATFSIFFLIQKRSFLPQSEYPQTSTFIDNLEKPTTDRNIISRPAKPDIIEKVPFNVASYKEIFFRKTSDTSINILSENSSVLIVDFPSLNRQGLALNRVAALIEKKEAPRDRILTSEELISFIEIQGDKFETFYLGHNYSGRKLAKFFNLADRQNINLSHQELFVRDVATKGRLINKLNGLWKAQEPEKILISSVQAASNDPNSRGIIDMKMRDTILRHEISHGDFVTRPKYRNYCIDFWNQKMTGKEREVFRQFISNRGYDVRDTNILIDEFQAFLVHTPDGRAFSAKLVGIAEKKLKHLRAIFVQGLSADSIQLSVPF